VLSTVLSFPQLICSLPLFFRICWFLFSLPFFTPRALCTALNEFSRICLPPISPGPKRLPVKTEAASLPRSPFPPCFFPFSLDKVARLSEKQYELLESQAVPWRIFLLNDTMIAYDVLCRSLALLSPSFSPNPSSFFFSSIFGFDKLYVLRESRPC